MSAFAPLVPTSQRVAGPSRLNLAGGTAASTVVACLPAALGAPPLVVAVTVIGFVVLGLVAWRPVLGVYLYLATLPMIAGMERGVLIPFIRPNEAVLVLAVSGAVIGAYVRAVRGVPLGIMLRPWDIPLAGFTVLATAWPICVMLLRGETPAPSDIAAVLPMVKLVGLLILVRTAVRTQKQALWCLRLLVAGALWVAVVALVQTLHIAVVTNLLVAYWPPYSPDLSRGTTTLSNAIATGDYILISLAVLVSAGARGLAARRSGVAIGLVLIAGLLAAGQFSSWLGALFVGALLIRRLPAMRASAVRLAPLLAVAFVLGAPALITRLAEFSGGTAPVSWLVRWDNLTYLYFPRLLEHAQFLVGVSPNSVVVPPDTWRSAVYLESGYLQFLWIGGVPLLVGFCWLTAAVLKLARDVEVRSDAIGACATGLAIGWWLVVLLSIFDAHLFMRGPGDLIFVLFGIVGGRAAWEGR